MSYIHKKARVNCYCDNSHLTIIKDDIAQGYRSYYQNLTVDFFFQTSYFHFSWHKIFLKLMWETAFVIFIRTNFYFWRILLGKVSQLVKVRQVVKVSQLGKMRQIVKMIQLVTI